MHAGALLITLKKISPMVVGAQANSLRCAIMQRFLANVRLYEVTIYGQT